MHIPSLIEKLVGRRFLWKLSRRLYLHARREGSLDMEENGEAALQRALARRAARDGRALTIFDVGANLGQWSSAMLAALRQEKAPRARMVLFEPVPPTRAKLTETMAGWAEVADIRIEPLALSDERGRATMVVTDPGAGIHHLESHDLNIAGSRIEVEISTLDDYLRANPEESIDFIKIDAEGFDPKVIFGMEDLLRRQKVDMIQFEYSVLFARSRCYLLDLFEVAKRHGYEVALLARDRIESFAEWHPDLEHFYASPMLLVRKGAETPLPCSTASYRTDNTRG